MKTAIIILGHGSKNKGADEFIRRISVNVKGAGGYEIVEHAFLQHARPGLEEALDNCLRLQAQKIVIVPFFLQSGVHVTKDIPKFVETAKKRHPDLDIIATDPAGAHPLMAKIVIDLVRKSDK